MSIDRTPNMKYYFSLFWKATHSVICVYEWEGMEWVVHISLRREKREREVLQSWVKGEMDVNVGEREREYVCVCVNVWVWI